MFPNTGLVRATKRLFSVVAVSLISTGTLMLGSASANEESSAQSYPETSADAPTQAAIEIFLEQRDWQRLASLLNSAFSLEDNPCLQEPRLRLLAGHAFLATGRNNMATLLFVCSSDSANSQNLAEWRTWTKELVRGHPAWSTAHYLYGDALARQGLMDEALFEFDQAVALDPEGYLTKNARGIVRWIVATRDSTQAALLDSAFVDLQWAAQQADFADAQANLGVLSLHEPHFPETASKRFEEALRRDPTFAMALNGHACAAGTAGDLEQLRNDLLQADSLFSGLPFVVANARALTDPNDRTSPIGKLAHSGAVGSERGFHADGGIVSTVGFLSGGIENRITTTHEHLTMHETWGANDLYHHIDLNRDITQTNRGGLYMLLKEGKNFFVDSEGNRRTAGTWFVLNYPAGNR